MKNIVLLSDGTGNGAAKKNQTNVWRLYRALNLHRKDQIAFYDDGVGSQEFLPFKILGGALGLGLKRNVIDLYKFLCRNYEPDAGNGDADKIYLFGFSRGAFTVRVLAGLIAHCGLYTGYKDENDLHETARTNYGAFRSSFKHGYLTWPFRVFFAGKPSEAGTVKPQIEFIGVWDTVDAYGLPIDELAILWDSLIFPIRFPDQRLSIKVKRACHAVSIDDERHTFHPVLWDESKEGEWTQDGLVEADRIEQVWFAGVHSDVGGGYPMNDLSLVPLDWMMSKVEAKDQKSDGLHFIPQFLQEIRSHSDWNGVQHDSRSGLGAYYRYKPREIERLCNDPDNKVTIERPKIHRGVLERIKRNAVPYAPVGLPKSYDVVSTPHDVKSTAEQPKTFETTSEARKRSDALNHALDIVYWRRWLYAAFLLTTLSLIFAVEFLLDPDENGSCAGIACLFAPLLEYAIDALPNFVADWLEALKQNPRVLVGFLFGFAILIVLKIRLLDQTNKKATAAWAALKGRGSPPDWTPSATSRFRNAARSKFGMAVKWGAASAVLILILAIFLLLAGRGAYQFRSITGFLCENSATTITENTKPVSFKINIPCFATSLPMKKGETYRFEVKPAVWKDGPTHKTGPDGFEHKDLKIWVPLRRHTSEKWLTLMGRVNSTGSEHFAIGTGLQAYTAKSDGELFLYVNDAVFGLFPGRYWAWPYFWTKGKNEGVATITISQVMVMN